MGKEWRDKKKSIVSAEEHTNNKCEGGDKLKIVYGTLL